MFNRQMVRKKIPETGLALLLVSATLLSLAVSKKTVTCVDYDSACESKGLSNCTFRNRTCEAGVEHCMAVFRRSGVTPGNSFKYIYLKCWPDWDVKRCPTMENHCLQVSPYIHHVKERNFAHCCCKGDTCNHPKLLKYVKLDRPPSLEAEPHPTERIVAKEAEQEDGVLYYGLVILLPLVLFCFCIILIYYLWRRFKCGRYTVYKPPHDLLMGGSVLSGCIADDVGILGHGAVGPDGYKTGTLIEKCKLLENRSRGRYGCVWLSKMRGCPYNKEDTKEREVAVKVFPPQDRQSWLTEQEIYRLRGLKHPNILRYIGSDQCGENVHAQLWIVTEYHPIGSVADFLRGNTVEYAQLLSILRTIAEGMRHLHEELVPHKPSIAHRDFKSKNVLLKSNLREACIADMGLALKFEVGQRVGDTHAQVGTRRYMAPEVLEGAIQFSRDAFLHIDTYAMGLVMWELMTRCHFSEASPPGDHSGVADNRPSVSEEEAVEREEAVETEEETDEGLAMLEDDSSHRSTPKHSPGGPSARPRGLVTGASALYRMPFELELGSQPSLEAMCEHVVQRKLRPKMNPAWQEHKGMKRLWDTLEECWDQDAEARLSAGLVMVRLESLEAELPPDRRLSPLGGVPPVAAVTTREVPEPRRDSSSSALGSSACSLQAGAEALPVAGGPHSAPPNAELRAGVMLV